MMCSTCKHRIKHIVWTGIGTVGWNGQYQCDRQYMEHDWKLRRVTVSEDSVIGKLIDESEPDVMMQSCPYYIPQRSKGQTALEAFL